MLRNTMWSSKVICSASSMADSDSKHSALGLSTCIHTHTHSLWTSSVLAGSERTTQTTEDQEGDRQEVATRLPYHDEVQQRAAFLDQDQETECFQKQTEVFTVDEHREKSLEYQPFVKCPRSSAERHPGPPEKGHWRGNATTVTVHSCFVFLNWCIWFSYFISMWRDECATVTDGWKGSEREP